MLRAVTANFDYRHIYSNYMSNINLIAPTHFLEILYLSLKEVTYEGITVLFFFC